MKKIATIIFCMMLMSILYTAITPGEKLSINTQRNETPSELTFNNVPIWERGERWSYRISNLELGNADSVLFRIAINDLSFTVVDTSGTLYNLKIKANIGGSFEFNKSLLMGFGLAGELKKSKMEGNIYFRKADLGLEKIDLYFPGKLSLDIEIPDFAIPLPNIPFRFTFESSLDFSSPLTLFNFPLEVGNVWGQSATELTIDGEIRSLWFNIIDFINNIYPIAPEIEILMPVISLKTLAEMYFGTNVLPIPENPIMYNCSSIEMRTVQAGTYESYKISIGEIFNYYYSPELRNIIEISLEPFYMELTNYEKNVNIEY
jgi:hypothetical protein